MDNKVTKSRLADFLSYEWILMIIIVVLSIVGWNFVYTVAGVKLSKGQQFMLSYDEYLTSEFGGEFITLAAQDQRFCYDVLQVGVESITPSNEQDVLSIRYNTRDVDVLVTDNSVKEDGTTRLKTIIDGYRCWSFDQMLKDGKSYLSKFVKNGIDYQSDQTVVYNYDNMNEQKIDSYFLIRQKGDNRFRNDEQKNQGKLKERKRIEKLCKELKTLDYLLTEHKDIFVQYKRFEQLLSKNPDDKELIDRIQYEKVECYALNLGALTDGEYQPSDFFTLDGSSKDLALISFNYLTDQPDLQYENISVLNFAVKILSNRLDGFTA